MNPKLAAALRVVAGVLLAIIGIALVLTDAWVALRAATGAHLINQCVGCGLILAGGVILDPADMATIVATIAPYLPFGKRP